MSTHPALAPPPQTEEPHWGRPRKAEKARESEPLPVLMYRSLWVLGSGVLSSFHADGRARAMDAPRVVLVDGVWRDREALTRHAGRAAETLVVRSPEAESPAARSRPGAESALSRPSKPDTRGMTSQQALRISVEKALSGTSSPRSIAAVRSAKWHLSTPRVGAGAFLNPKFFSHGAGRSPRSPESSSAQRTGVPNSTALLPISTSAPAPEPAPAQHQSPRDYIRNLERIRNADSVATLVRGVDLSKEMVRQIETGALDP
ncbi:MAG: hypothetical protein ACPIOQ_08325, partial [Promethearchaeia archaeon]